LDDLIRWVDELNAESPETFTEECLQMLLDATDELKQLRRAEARAALPPLVVLRKQILAVVSKVLRGVLQHEQEYWLDDTYIRWGLVERTIVNSVVDSLAARAAVGEPGREDEETTVQAIPEEGVQVKRSQATQGKVLCSKCMCYQQAVEMDVAIARWNRRAEARAALPPLEELDNLFALLKRWREKRFVLRDKPEKDPFVTALLDELECALLSTVKALACRETSAARAAVEPCPEACPATGKPHRFVGAGEYGDTTNGLMCGDCGVDAGDVDGATQGEQPTSQQETPCPGCERYPCSSIREVELCQAGHAVNGTPKQPTEQGEQQ